MPHTASQTVIDWASTGAMLQGIGPITYGLGTLLGAGAVFAAAVIGSNTFNRWRQQKLSERRIEQAERILTATYKVRRGLSMVRSPMMWAYETDVAEQKLREAGQWDQTPDKDKKKLAEAQAYYSRLNATKDDRQALEECQPMARALFGEELEKAIETLAHQFHTVRVYVDANHRDKQDADRPFREKIESAIWEGYPSRDKNEVDQTIEAQVTLIEAICVPVLRLEGVESK